MTKNIVKFFGGAVLVVALGMGALFVIDYIRYQKSPEYQAQKEAEQIKKEYAEDPYGGDTPEQTLQLFIEALKKGDMDLAVKYFVLDKQEEWRADLAQIQEKGLLDEMIGDLEREKYKNRVNDNYFTFSIANDQNEVALTITITRGLSKKWKIQDL